MRPQKNLRAKLCRNSTLAPRRQTGQALLIFLGLLALIMVAGSIGIAGGTQQSATFRNAQTQAALNAARQALIAYASGTSVLSGCVDNPTHPCVRVGELPCPDLTNNGFANASGCGASGQRLGRLPWKTLGLPDLRDGTGERLWYAVSPAFISNPRSVCAAPGAAGCLNSSTAGAATVKDRFGSVQNDGTVASTAAIAVVIAPGDTLTRLDSVAQDRSCTGDASVANCRQTGICSSINTPLCKAINYLDIAPTNEDNAIFAENDNTAGFISGPILNSNGLATLNDVVLAVTYDDLMPAVQRRVGKEVMNCLTTYAAQNSNRYPWAAPATQAGPSSYYTTFADQPQYYFGHLPDQLNQTQGSGNSNGFGSPGTQLAATWPTSGCNIGSLGGALWWMNWKDLVYYAVAPAYAPDAPTPGGAPTGCSGSDCLSVDSGGNVTKVMVFVAGRAIGGELRTYPSQNVASNYLEGSNASTSDNYASWITSHSSPFPPPSPPLVFQSGPQSATFNDLVISQ